MKARLLLVFILLVACGALAQQVPSDSLWNIWQDTKQHDTARLRALNDHAWGLFFDKQIDSAFALSEVEYDFANVKQQKKFMAFALNLTAMCHHHRKDFEKALEFQNRSLKLKEEIGDRRSIASSLSNIGFIYYDMGDLDKAIEYMELTIDRLEELDDKKGVVLALMDAGSFSKGFGDFPKALMYYHRALPISEEVDDKKYRAQLFNKIGLIYKGQGDYPRSLEYYQHSLKIREEIDDKKGAAIVLNNIGLIYKGQGDNSNALDYLQRSLKLKEEIGYSTGIESTMSNIGVIYSIQHKYSEALEILNRVLTLREASGDKDGMASAMTNIGDVYRDLGEYDKAMDYFQRSLEIREALGFKKELPVVYASIGRIFTLRNEPAKSLPWCEKGLKIAEEVGLVIDQHDACECLYRAHKALGNGASALQYHEKLVALQDSLFNEENTKRLTQLAMQYEFDKQEAAAKVEQEKKDAIAAQELRRQKLVRNGFMGGFAVVLLFAGVFFVQRNQIGKEKERSEELLLNILPEEVADELKEKGHSDAQLIDEVTVLFTDFKGFTALSEKITPKELVKDLHECFSAFDNICEKYGIEKIKTIGDAYMAAGGLPSPNSTHAQDVVNAALEMAEVIEKGKAKKIAVGLPFFEIRIGVHTGPVVAGIVGVKKFQYDIWGDTVNTASRMESSGEVGQVNISQATYGLVKDEVSFTFIPRGKVQAKGKGEMEMYFVKDKTA